jgi:HK97 family phage major capsid protein
MDKLLKELRKLLDSVKEYRGLDKDGRTEERRERHQQEMARIKEVEDEIRELREIEDLEARHQQTNFDVPEFRSADVVDKPIYDGPTALGQQMVDIAAVTRNTGNAAEARSRLEQSGKRAEQRAAGTGGHVQAVGSDGGFLLSGETAMDMFTNGFNNSEILRRTSNRNIGTSQFVDLVGIDETSRAAGSRGGGVRVYTDSELGLITQSKTKFDKIRIEPKKLTGLYFASEEILMNAPLLQGEMSALFDEEFAFKTQDLVINGTGSGEAQGILNADCLVPVAKESGQGAATILFENLVKMKARIRWRNRDSLVWVANQDVEPQLYQLALPVGTGGSVMPVYLPNNSTLMGIPIVFVEQCATLGTVGDIMLCDFSAYITANKGGVDSASSIHLKFDYAQVAFRFMTWFDGQPRLKAAITPYKGSNTVSPFVALATRS